ncbi:hypothetical protein EDD15DRAFT_140743 [Pisolithus albus]|nr:hypothetical protein EDD15DRAFT_140743 [Pisolithus albus]
MARTQSKKRRLCGLVKTSNSTSGLASSAGRSETRVGDLPSIPETLGRASPGMLARMRRFFRRSNTQASGVPQVAPDQDFAARTTGEGVQEQQELAQAAPTEHAENSIAKPEPELESELGPKLKPDAQPTPASVGQDVDAAVKEFDGINPISGIANGEVDAVGIVNNTVSGIQTLSDTYLKPFKVFNQVVSTLANVHPYAQAALGILTFTSQVPPRFQYPLFF